jgi:hypothetical protein
MQNASSEIDIDYKILRYDLDIIFTTEHCAIIVHKQAHSLRVLQKYRPSKEKIS